MLHSNPQQHAPCINLYYTANSDFFFLCCGVILSNKHAIEKDQKINVTKINKTCHGNLKFE